MKIMGCDFHPGVQQIPMLDTETGQRVRKRLQHASGEAEPFYRSLQGQRVQVGIEACGNTRWFERLLRELGYELLIGDATRIRAAVVRKQKNDERDADHLLELLETGRFPKIWVPSPEERDLRQLLLHRHKLVQMRTRVKNQLQHVALDRKRLEREGHVRLNFTGNGVADAPRLQNAPGQLAGGMPAPPPFLPFASGNFATPSGKAELYSESLQAQGLHPVVDFTPPAESRHGSKAKSFPLELLARKADNFLNSTFSNLPVTQQMEELGLLEINAADARVRGIADGDAVRVFNRRGDIRLKARVDGTVQPGVVSARLHWAKLSAGNRNINVLTSEKLTDLGNSATFYSVLVEVELSKAAS
jgi:anaerobic selenocysteine-containing dehydrogenase